MFADISHERQQSLLRQRNLPALTSAGLGLALVAATTDVGEALACELTDTARDLATALAPYMAGRTYGAFFEG